MIMGRAGQKTYKRVVGSLSNFTRTYPFCRSSPLSQTNMFPKFSLLVASVLIVSSPSTTDVHQRTNDYSGSRPLLPPAQSTAALPLPRRAPFPSRGTLPSRAPFPSRGTLPSRAPLPSRATLPSPALLPSRAQPPSRAPLPRRAPRPSRAPLAPLSAVPASLTPPALLLRISLAFLAST
jgi:hypothetical protein